MSTRRPVSVTKKQAAVVIFIIGTTAGAVWQAADSKYEDLENRCASEMDDCRAQRELAHTKLDECNERLLYFLAPDHKTDFPTMAESVELLEEEKWEETTEETDGAWMNFLNQFELPDLSL